MGKRLQTVEDHVTDITISTATVDIQVMRIGTKQMTLAVFRQLPFENIFDGWGLLRARPWGWVSYDYDGSAKPFVFSYQGILYRCNVSLQAHDAFVVEPETETKIEEGHYEEEPYRYIPEKKLRIPTGNWLIHAKQGYYYDFCRVAECEEDARNYLANRMHSVGILKAAPQLFIGV